MLLKIISVMDMIIKRTKEYEKAIQVAKMCEDCFETGMQQLIKDIRLHLLYGAFIKEELVGFVTYKENNEDVIETSWLAVSPEQRGKGIGTKLIMETRKELKRKYKICEVKTLAETHMDAGYAKTRNFYKKLGFISLEIISPYPGWGVDNPCQIFVKFLR